MMKENNARRAALEALTRCRRDGAWSGDTLDSILKRSGLEKRDAALASRLCLGVLQNETLCDYYIGCFCTSKLEPQVRDILRLGVYQLLFLDRIPARAAVSETVELCRLSRCERASGLVNAVLRRIAAEKDRLPAIPGEGTAEYLSVRYSHPAWLCEYLAGKKGYAFSEAFLASNNQAAKLSLQVNTLKVKTADYLRALERAEIPFSVKEPDGCLELDGGFAAELPGYEDGLFYVQDRAARLAAEIAGAEPGMRVLDACACPGGKSFASAIRMEDHGSILSCDIHKKKLRMLENGAERLGIHIVETCAMDARVYDPAMEKGFDLVIADVPCSGLGVIAKKPEIRRKDPKSLRGLPGIQLSILKNLSRYVKPGGVLLYSTCTILRRENEAVVEAFLDAHPEFSTAPLELPGIGRFDRGMKTLLPCREGTDGFFLAKLIKRND
jgi:ribosomal RNA small subunit methyltransferase RsmB